MNAWIRDITGRRYGRLIALRPTEQRLDKAVVWECRCDCGNVCFRSQRNLHSRRTTSCGCKRAEFLSGGKPTHRMSNTSTYAIWAGIKRRCLNARTPSFQGYGAKGITICERWRDSFEAFLDDMGTRPSGMQIDRIDYRGPYAPGNCRWVTPMQQQNNRSSNHRIRIGEQTGTLSEWARAHNLRPLTALERIRRGWPEAEAVTTPVGVQRCA